MNFNEEDDMFWNEITSLRVLRKLRELIYLTWITQVMRIDREENMRPRMIMGWVFKTILETNEMIWEQMGDLSNTWFVNIPS